LHKVAKVILRGYREWTESLGDDREWLIQKTQAEIDRAASIAAKEVNAFYLPTRKDVLIFILNGVRDATPILRAVEEASPVPVRVVLGCGKTPLEAIKSDEDCEGSSPIAAVHVDINSFTSKDVYVGYLESVQLLEDLLKIGLGFGALGAYLGGDNVVLFSDPSVVEELALFVTSMYDVKVGVGVAENARRALALAAKALRKLRENRRERLRIEGR